MVRRWDRGGDMKRREGREGNMVGRWDGGEDVERGREGKNKGKCMQWKVEGRN